MRRLVAETRLRRRPTPLFVREGIDEPVPIPSLPGWCSTRGRRCAEAELADLGERRDPFGVPEHKDAEGPAHPIPTASCRSACGTCATTPRRPGRAMAADSASTSTPNTATNVRPRRHPSTTTHPRVYGEAAIVAPTPGPTMRPVGMMDGPGPRHPDALRRQRPRAGVDRLLPAEYASALYGPFRDVGRRNIADGGDRSPVGLGQRPRGSRRSSAGTTDGGRRHGDGQTSRRPPIDVLAGRARSTRRSRRTRDGPASTPQHAAAE